MLRTLDIIGFYLQLQLNKRFLFLLVLYLSVSLVSSFQCYTSEYYIENTTFDSNVTLANCTGSRNYCLTQKYVIKTLIYDVMMNQLLLLSFFFLI